MLDCDGAVWHGRRGVLGRQGGGGARRRAAAMAAAFFLPRRQPKSRDHYAAKFASLGMSVSRYQIYTSAYATACYLQSLGFDEITETERRERSLAGRAQKERVRHR